MLLLIVEVVLCRLSIVQEPAILGVPTPSFLGPEFALLCSRLSVVSLLGMGIPAIISIRTFTFVYPTIANILDWFVAVCSCMFVNAAIAKPALTGCGPCITNGVIMLSVW